MLPFRLFYKAMFFVYTVAYVKILVKRTKIRNISYTLWTLSIYIYIIYILYRAAIHFAFPTLTVARRKIYPHQPLNIQHKTGKTAGLPPGLDSHTHTRGNIISTQRIQHKHRYFRVCCTQCTEASLLVFQTVALLLQEAIYYYNEAGFRSEFDIQKNRLISLIQICTVYCIDSPRLAHF